ncbi:GntR family transcriptional regulator [Alginatibacterium sediminis]|uniref:GntR family transcriptional regulator n=1 Tax=Alginatibacterium sediminis TaxID=2164068 RepID=A0A420EB90_9ALTE|nr:FCD domain-containing protein [Alginatibacterium sediminis]RKF17945.1 GntR family transcriptional regulator [Alginatibacterium sediminis]
MSNQRRYQEIGRKIELLLLSGEFSPGARLPSERELSEQFGASRAIIREAVIMLELKGLVEVKQGAGIFFLDFSDSNTVLEDAISEIGPFELLQARQLLETNIASFAATQIKANEIKEMRMLLVEQESEINGDSLRFNELDHQFHKMIAESTQNNLLIQMAESMWANVRTNNSLWEALNNQFLHEERLQNLWLSDHKKILMALQRRSPQEAKLVVWQHIEHAKQELFKLANVDEPDFDGYMYTANSVPTLDVSSES